MDFVRGLATDPLLMGGEVDRILLQSRHAARTWRISPGLLRHALGNVMRNALRYGAGNTTVSVVIGRRGHRHWIHVLNHGVKIPAEVVAKLFEPGKKSSSGGMGLGLYIAQTCTERMGGRLVFGTTSKCTVFSIVLEDGSGDVVDMLPKAAGFAS